MAAPEKTGLSYFPRRINLDERLKHLIRKYGPIADSIYFHLLSRIYAEGYWTFFRERDILDFSEELNIDIDLLKIIFLDLINEELFDKELYRKYLIITSRGIQKTYISCCERRNNIYYIDHFLLVDLEEYPTLQKKGVFKPTGFNGSAVNIERIESYLNIDMEKKIEDKLPAEKQLEFFGDMSEQYVWFPTEEDFLDCWRLYPKREMKKSAYIHFKASVKTKEDLANLKKAIINYAAMVEKEKRDYKYIKQGNTFFNNWKDFVDMPSTATEEKKQYRSLEDYQ